MKIVVIGGNGLIGSQLVERLQQLGHQATAASRSSGVNLLTGAGVSEALRGAETVVDVSNSPSFEDQAVMEFFETSGKNLAQAEVAAGIKHHLALSVVGTDRLQASGYFRAKLVQENLIKESGIPYTIVRATQFFEFIPSIAEFAASGPTIRLSSAMMQPIDSRDVVEAMVQYSTHPALNKIVDIAGPDKVRMDELVRQLLSARNDSRTVLVDQAAGYFGTPVDDTSLVPMGEADLGTRHFNDWLQQSMS